MTTTEEQSNAIARGRAAKVLLDDPTFKEAYDVALGQLFAEFVAIEEPNDKMYDIWAQANALGKLKTVLDSFVAHGKIEERNREQDLRKY